MSSWQLLCESWHPFPPILTLEFCWVKKSCNFKVLPAIFPLFRFVIFFFSVIGIFWRKLFGKGQGLPQWDIANFWFLYLFLYPFCVTGEHKQIQYNVICMLQDSIKIQTHRENKIFMNFWAGRYLVLQTLIVSCKNPNPLGGWLFKVKLVVYNLRDFPEGTSGKESDCKCRGHKRHGFETRVRKIPWSRKWQPTPVFLPGESHGQRSLAGCNPWGCKESDMTEHARVHTHTHTHTHN